MRTRVPAMLMVFVPLGLAPIAALAQSCGDYPLTDEQQAYLAAQQLEIAIPEGEVPVIQRCDIDGDNTVDIDDIRAISEKRNQPTIVSYRNGEPKVIYYSVDGQVARAFYGIDD